jgi:hypothetical protein
MNLRGLFMLDISFCFSIGAGLRVRRRQLHGAFALRPLVDIHGLEDRREVLARVTARVSRRYRPRFSTMSP